MFERMTWDAAPPLREAGGIAIVAAGSNLSLIEFLIIYLKLENMSKMNEKGMDSCCKYYS